MQSSVKSFIDMLGDDLVSDWWLDLISENSDEFINHLFELNRIRTIFVEHLDDHFDEVGFEDVIFAEEFVHLIRWH